MHVQVHPPHNVGFEFVVNFGQPEVSLRGIDPSSTKRFQRFLHLERSLPKSLGEAGSAREDLEAEAPPEATEASTRRMVRALGNKKRSGLGCRWGWRPQRDVSRRVVGWVQGRLNSNQNRLNPHQNEVKVSQQLIA